MAQMDHIRLLLHHHLLLQAAEVAVAVAVEVASKLLAATSYFSISLQPF